MVYGLVLLRQDEYRRLSNIPVITPLNARRLVKYSNRRHEVFMKRAWQNVGFVIPALNEEGAIGNG